MKILKILKILIYLELQFSLYLQDFFLMWYFNIELEFSGVLGEVKRIGNVIYLV